MLPNRLGVVMIHVSDMDRSVAFYRDVLGIPLKFESPFWSEFATEGVTLALHGGAEANPGVPQLAPPAGTIALGWNVPDLDATAAELRSRGVRFAMEPQDRREEGIRLAVILDP